MYRNNWIENLVTTPFVDNFSPSHQNGPDYVLPTEDQSTWVVDAPTKMRLEVGDPSFQPISVVTHLKQTVTQYGRNVALVTKRNGQEKKWTYSDYWNDVQIAAKGFIKLGLARFSAVCILGYNAPEWFLTHLGSIFAGGVTAGIYTTNSPEACYHILNDCSANIVVVENEIQLQKIMQIKNTLPNIKAIVQYSGTPTQPDVLSWDELMMIGRSVPDEVLERRIKSLAINQCCTLIYTSGTTGNAKGVMLSHDNIVYTISYFVRKIWRIKQEAGTLLSYLPLSHIAALQTDLYASIYIAGATHFAPPDVLKGKLVEALTEVKPAIILGVPRVWEKICEKIRDAENTMKPIKRNLVLWSRKQAAAHNYNNLTGDGHSTGGWNYVLAKRLVLKKLKRILGIDQCTTFICGGAPMTHDVLGFFLSLDVIIGECFGMSETAGPHVANVVREYSFGSVGKLSCSESTILGPNEKGHGELLIRGRNVFMGYLNLRENTLATLENNGWLHSGDVGFQDKDGFITITGRIKELIITSGGENVAPVPVEDAIKELLPIVSCCMLIGDKRKFLSLIMTLKTDVNLETMIPTDTLSPSAMKWCNDFDCDVSTVSEILRGPNQKVVDAIQQKINEYNTTRAISNAQRIQKWAILPVDFSIPGGELGPSLKLKRPTVLDKYSDIIKGFYAE